MSKYDKIIATLYPNAADAAFAKSLVARFSSDPRMDGGRLEAMLREGARVNELAGGGQMSPEHARELLSGFAESIGTAPDVMSALGNWYDTVGDEVAAEPSQPETEPPQMQPAKSSPAQPVQPVQPQALAPARPAGPTRAQLQQEIAKHQANMRAPEGSPEWRAYWKEGGSAAYAEALQALETVPETAAPPPTLAGGAAAPAVAAEPAP